MRAYETKKFRLENCLRCGGYWFSESQLLALNESLDPDLKWLDLDFWKQRVEFRVSHNLLCCPKCRNVQLLNVIDKVTDTSAATCPVCQGLWLKADQLNRLLNAIANEVEYKSSSDYSKQSLRVLKDIVITHRKKPIEDWHELKAVLRLLKYRLYSEHPKLVDMLIGTQKSLPL
jgi:Zn-finger nucleic acid-binding protein